MGPVRLPLVLLMVTTLAAPALSACAPSTDGAAAYAAITAAPPPDRARLVVYRPAANHLLGRLADHDVTIDGAAACALGDDRFFVRDVAGGTIRIGAGDSERAIAAAPGQETFVRVGFNPRRASLAGWILPVLGFADETRAPDSGLFAIEPVDPSIAVRELAWMRPDPTCH
jgi:hypothetical protein